jgi:hypothetical protein
MLPPAFTVSALDDAWPAPGFVDTCLG